MPGPRPTAAFEKAKLDVATIGAGERLGHVWSLRHTDPLGFGKSPSRFSDPRRLVAARRFGVLYLGGTLAVCFLETMLRDHRDGVVGDYPIAENELRTQRGWAEVEVSAPLTVVDLRGAHPVRMGIPSDVARGTVQAVARHWSVALHGHPQAPDGIVYSSRLNGETNVAVYDRAIPRLRVVRSCPLIDAPGLAAVLDEFRVALV